MEFIFIDQNLADQSKHKRNKEEAEFNKSYRLVLALRSEGAQRRPVLAGKMVDLDGGEVVIPDPGGLHTFLPLNSLTRQDRTVKTLR